MSVKSLCVFLTAFSLSIAAIAGEERRRHIEITVDDGDGPVHFDSSELDFDLDELQLGESRSAIDKNGNTLFIVRTEAGFELDVNGRKIDLPSMEPAEAGAEGEGDVYIKRRLVVEDDESGASEDAEVVEERREIRVVRERANVTN